MKKNLNKDLLVYVQFILFFVLAILFVMSFFITELEVITYLLMGVLLIVMCINNYRMKKNKILTILCGLTGILVIVMELFSL